MTKWYVIDKRSKCISHEGSEPSCRQYVANASSLFGGSYMVVYGTTEANHTLKSLRG